MTVKADKKGILKQEYDCEGAECIHTTKSSTSSSEVVNCGNIVPKEAIEEFEGVHSTLWSSIYIAAALSFVGSVQFSLYFASLWPYLQIIDRSVSETFFGYIIAIYSVGQIMSSPTFGFWSNRICQVRLPLLVGLILMFIGNALYIALEIPGVSKRLLLILGRLITGMGSGNVSLLRTYASTASTIEDRPRAIAYVTCGQALGSTFGPALQLFFTTLTYPGINLTGSLRLNMYTAPAYLACAMNIVGALALFYFREDYAGLIQQTPKKEEEAKKIPPYDILAVCICYISRFTQMFINTNLETIGSPFSMMMFGWTESKAVTFTSAAQGAVGVLTFTTYFAFIVFKLERFVSFRGFCVFSLFGLIVFHLITYSYPFLPGNVQKYNSSTKWVLEQMDSKEEPVGCNTDKFDWCEDLRPVNVYLYYCTYILALGFAFPILNITVTTLFSKILGPRRQGTQQGFFQMSGGVARMLGPIFISTLYSAYGPPMAWSMEIFVIGTTLILWFCFYNRMVPLRVKPINEKENLSVNKNEFIFVNENISK